jgi:hypothetical protein
MDQFTSRKFIITAVLGLLIYLGPVLYKLAGVSESVALLALGSVTTLGSAYLGFNVLQKKIEGPPNG